MNKNNDFGVMHIELEPRFCPYETFYNYCDRNVANSFLFTNYVRNTRDALIYLKGKEKRSWIKVGGLDKDGNNLDSYMEYIDKTLDMLREGDAFEEFTGFYLTKPLANGQSNENLLKVTKALSEKYGKRIFVTFSPCEIIGLKDDKYSCNGKDVVMLDGKYTEYITDYALDSLGYDFREESQKLMEARLEEIRKVLPEAKTVKDYFEKTMEILSSKMTNPDVRAWAVSLARTSENYTGKKADENFCVANFKGLKEIILNQKNPGGIILDEFKSKSLRERGTDYYLCEDCPELWQNLLDCCTNA